MRHLTWRHIASTVLLATYLPMVMLSSIHVHHETVDAHDDCLQCAGHIESHHHHEHDCLYCLFLSLNYLGQADGQSNIILPATDRCPAFVAEQSATISHGVSLLRAPPMA